ncbi:MAG: oligosaccharide flippase family protein [Proteobacteria bacterium]|nr:oligosaccharide flippase family protein [Pseudomonadota bacterium]
MIIIRLVRNAILARVLGPTYRGVFSLICALPELICTAGNLGYSTSIEYYTSQKDADIKSIVGSILVFCLVAGSILSIIAFFLMKMDWIIRDNEAIFVNYSIVIAIVIPFFLFKIINTSYLMARSFIGIMNMLRLLESSMSLLLFLLLWLVFKLDSLDAAVFSWFINLVFICLMGIIWLKKDTIFPLKFTFSAQKKILNFGIRSHFETLFQKMLLRIDFLLISSLLGAKALGYYAMATAAAELILTIPEAIAIPLLSFLMGADNMDQKKVTPTVLRMLNSFMLIITIVMALSGKLLILLLFGKDYLPAFSSLLYLLPGILALCHCTILRLDLLGKNMPGTLSLISGTGVLMNILLNMIFIPKFGIEGAAISSSIAYSFCAIILQMLYTRLTGIPPLQTLLINKNDFITLHQLLTKILSRLKNEK